jgi:hypothetical protein
MIEKSSSASNLRTRGIFALKAYRYLVINIFAHGHNHIREKNASKEKSEEREKKCYGENKYPPKQEKLRLPMQVRNGDTLPLKHDMLSFRGLQKCTMLFFEWTGRQGRSRLC